MNRFQRIQRKLLCRLVGARESKAPERIWRELQREHVSLRANKTALRQLVIVCSAYNYRRTIVDACIDYARVYSKKKLADAIESLIPLMQEEGIDTCLLIKEIKLQKYFLEVPLEQATPPQLHLVAEQ